MPSGTRGPRSSPAADAPPPQTARPPGGPIRTPKFAEILADRLRAHILASGLRPGDPLSSEADIIASYGVARATAREALRLLEADGLIEIRRGRQGGLVVRQPDLRRLSDSVALMLALRGTTMAAFLDFRLLIEPAAASAAAATASQDERHWLVGVADAELGQDVGHSARFHQAVARCSHNDLLHITIDMLADEMARHVPSERLTEADIGRGHRAHRAVAVAIRSGDGDRAALVMRRHITALRGVLNQAGRLNEPIVPRDQWLDLMRASGTPQLPDDEKSLDTSP